MSSGVTTGTIKTKAQKRVSPVVEFFTRLIKEKPLGTVGGVIVLVLLIVGIFANFLAPYGMNEVHPSDALSPPSTKYLLGTDNLGRDLLSRVIYGARISVIVGVVAATCATAISTTIGMLSGFLGGKFDIVVQRIIDGWMCFPGIIILITAVTIIGPGLWQVILVLSFTYGIGGSRIVRSAVIGIKGNVYLDAAKSTGCSTTKMLMRHILPNIMAPVIVLFTTRMPAMIMDEASLSFLGLGIPPPQPSWGGMLSYSGIKYMLLDPLIAIWPGLALTFTVYGVNMLGDAVRDLLDPRLRGGVGRYGGVNISKKQLAKK